MSDGPIDPRDYTDADIPASVRAATNPAAALVAVIDEIAAVLDGPSDRSDQLVAMTVNELLPKAARDRPDFDLLDDPEHAALQAAYWAAAAAVGADESQIAYAYDRIEAGVAEERGCSEMVRKA